MSSNTMSTVHIKPKLDHDFSFRADSFNANVDRDNFTDEANTINDMVANEDWYKVSLLPCE